MATLTRMLPKPKYSGPPKPPSISDLYAIDTPAVGAKAGSSQSQALTTKGAFEPPPYGQRSGFIPRTAADFGDGGAFPEIHVTQYPLDMGKKDDSGKAVVPLAVDAEGNLQYDAIVRQGHKADRVIFSKFTDLIPKDVDEASLQRPSEEEERETAERTRKALGKIVEKQISLAQPTHIEKQDTSKPTFIRYTPSSATGSDNSGSKQRLIRMQSAQVDPLEPPKFRHIKVPGGGGSPPVPVVHSPPRKITVEDQKNWKIPPCISNWKNIKGYTIPLDKRLAADGRGLQDVQVSSSFANLSEALYHAEQNARKEIEQRAKMTSDITRHQKQKKEQELRELATKAREEVARSSAARRAEEEEADIDARNKRDELRKERHREIRREMRMEHMGKDLRESKAAKARRDEDRDVSEQIALGKQPKQSNQASYDQRLFNQEVGLSAGFGADDSYGVYDKPLFRGSSASQIYRPKKNADDELYGEDEVKSMIEKSTAKFAKPDRGFKGAETSGVPRDKPVAFEKDEEDPFGMGQFLQEANKKGTLDGIGKSGQMAAAGGAARGDELSREHSGRNVEFQESRRDANGRSPKRSKR